MIIERVAEMFRRAERQVPGMGGHGIFVLGQKTWHEAHAANEISPSYTADGPSRFRRTGWPCVVDPSLPLDALRYRFEVHE